MHRHPGWRHILAQGLELFYPLGPPRSPRLLELVESLLGLILLDPLVPAAGHHLSAGLDVIQGGDELKPVLSDETRDEQMNMSS